MTRLRVMYIVGQYPQLSETYIRTEINALAADFELGVVSVSEPNYPYRSTVPYRSVGGLEELCDAVAAFAPDVLHTHWFHDQLALVLEVARRFNVPFTVRTHSFDTLWITASVPGFIANAVEFVKDELCLGVLAFPFAVPTLERLGVPSHKLRSSYPVVDYAAFLDRSPNGTGVMNVGACLPKKSFESYLGLGRSMPEQRFDLYAIGYDVERIRQLNDALGRPVVVVDPVEPERMPAEYKKHRWLVVTASREIGTVGWPLCIAEAQASGVGVCAPNLRADMREYVGECGYLYESLDEVREIIARPFPEELREAGFEHAQRSDIRRHVHVLTDLWNAAIPSFEAEQVR